MTAVSAEAWRGELWGAGIISSLSGGLEAGWRGGLGSRCRDSSGDEAQREDEQRGADRGEGEVEVEHAGPPARGKGMSS